ncbi:hypothetical protein B0T26DRAFT_866899 [Lasiosphaeria miniovina]|uniref:Uncharacterized protein n=1 Tax=Lasiosphaeria miniovina TaxID=1954250 RepID=A0AA40BG72_9PEZI|nr:uncharacterized protein B0T26DRAFT_866899 [Lasiosphaeria miniovina]KAK0733659.1 hypothetical protein B0T26DRAFT_866899 [Lasiosphaeria miniovina]
MPQASLEIAGCGEVPCDLDALLRTLISGNTLMALANAAIKNLAAHYGICAEGTGAGSINWEKVRLSPHNELVQVIRMGGISSRKSIHIKKILDMVYEESLERMDNTAIIPGAEAPESPLEHLLDRDKDDPVAREHAEEPDMGVV